MKEIVESLLQAAITALQSTEQSLKDISLDIKVSRTKDKKHGDFATNVALILASKCDIPARKIAEMLVASLPKNSYLDKVDIAGPGFINFYTLAQDKLNIIPTILTKNKNFGYCNVGNSQKILLEFVSANPTGPLHVGHGRSAAFGATLANVLRFAGYDVVCEYYVNDAGRQMDILAASVWLRYIARIDETVVFPDNAYKGEYVIDIAENIYKKYGNIYQHPWSKISEDLPLDESFGGDKERYIDAVIIKAKSLLGLDGFDLFHKAALDSVLDDIKNDLAEFGVVYESWFSEKSLLDDKSIEKGLNALKDAGYTYEKEGAIWFRATDFGDEKDRVLVRANGQSTYFASDVAYHWHKYSRGFEKVINIFGADHHGYITRLKSAVKALKHDENALEVLLVQFAILYRGDTRVQMSTRSGSFVTLRELRNEVGNDAARFFYVMRKADNHMDFDLDLAKSESSDNPVYYIQYAHARICSVLKQLTERNLDLDDSLGLKSLHLLTSDHEINLLDTLSCYPDVIKLAATSYEVHQLAYYLRDLATGLHSYYNAIQLLCEDLNLRSARLVFLKAIRQVICNGLTLLGVSSPESM